MTDWTDYTAAAPSASFDLVGTNQFYTNTTNELYLPDPLIDWLPYKVEKYIPTWHLMRSYRK